MRAATNFAEFLDLQVKIERKILAMTTSLNITAVLAFPPKLDSPRLKILQRFRIKITHLPVLGLRYRYRNIFRANGSVILVKGQKALAG